MPRRGPTKTEWLQLHGILYRVRETLINEGYRPAIAFQKYDQHDTLPTHIHKPHKNHAEAVRLLLEAIDHHPTKTTRDWNRL